MISRLALLAGLFLVPALLLRLGHRLRRRPERAQRAFWGVAAGHTLGLVATTTAALYPPVGWEGGAWARDAAVHWAMLAGAAAGGALALLGGRRAS